VREEGGREAGREGRREEGTVLLELDVYGDSLHGGTFPKEKKGQARSHSREKEKVEGGVFLTHQGPPGR